MHRSSTAAGNEQSGRLALVGLRRVCGVRILLGLKGIGFSIRTDPDAILALLRRCDYDVRDPRDARLTPGSADFRDIIAIPR